MCKSNQLTVSNMNNNINYIKNINLLNYSDLVKGDNGAINFAIAVILKDNIADDKKVSLIKSVMNVSGYACFD